MDEIIIKVPEGKEARWVNNALTLVDKNLRKFRFNVGDRVTINNSPFTVFTIAKQLYQNGEPYYEIDRRYGYYPPYKESELTLYTCEPKVKYKYKVGEEVMVKDTAYKIKECTVDKGKPAYYFYGIEASLQEEFINGYPFQDITKRIKTFEDACDWCINNNHLDLVCEFEDVCKCGRYVSPDIKGLLKLRIITAALNEGWEPKFEEEEERWYVACHEVDGTHVFDNSYFGMATSNRLIFKSRRLADYASWRFEDFYRDFYGVKKGGKK